MSAPTIDTPRLRLRAWRPADIDPWTRMCADERVMVTLGGVYRRARALADAERLAARLVANGYGWWVVEIKDGPPFAGLACLQHVPFEAPFTPAFEVGWRFAYEAWGRGYATEAGRAAIDFAFEVLDHTEVVAVTAGVNVRSRAVMERIGMTRDPRDDFPHPRFAPEHPLHAHVLYRIGRPAR